MLFYSVATITWASITLATLPPDYIEPTDNGNGQKVEHPSKNQQHRSTQILQPYTFEKLSSKSVHTSATHNPLTLVANFGSNSDVSSYSRSTEASGRSPVPKLSDKFVPVESDQNHDDLSAVLPNDELLFLQNAGNFGRRIQASPTGETGLKGVKLRQFEDHPWIRKNNVVARTVYNERDLNGALSLSEKKDGKERRLSQYLYSQQLFTPKSAIRVNISDKSSHNFVGSTTAFASSHTTDRVPHVSTTSADPSSNNPINNESVDYEYNNTIEAGKLANIDSSRYFINGMVNTKLEVTSPRFINYEENNVPTIKERKQQIDSETAVVTTTGSFSRPIVVAEIPRYNSSEHGTSSECADNNAVSSISRSKCSDALRTASSTDAFPVTPKPQVENHLTTSSVILNPIQAGVVLVNEEEAYLLNNNNVNPLIPVEKDVDADFRDVSTSDGQMIMANVDELDSRSSHGKANTIPNKQQHEQQKKTNDVIAPMDFDHEIEIQKSVEVYHNMPVQEIHYPVELAVSQLPYIEHLKAQQIKLTNDPSDIGLAHQTDLQGIDQKLSNSIRGRNDLRACSVEQAANVAQQTYEVIQGNAPQGGHSSCRYLNDIRNALAINQRSNFEGARTSTRQQVDDSSVVHQRSNLQKIQSEVNNNQYGFRLNQDYRPAELNSPLTYVLKASKEITTPNVQFVTKLIQKPVDRTIEQYLSAPKLPSNPNEIGKEVAEKEVRVSQPLVVELTRLVEKPDNKLVDDKVESKMPELLPIRLPQSDPPEVERVVLKKIHVAQPYPVHIQVPVDGVIEKIVQIPQPYVVEKIVRNNIPYPVEVATILEKNGSQLNEDLGKVIERKVPQLFPVHVGLLQPYPVKEAIEKQVPYSVEKALENSVPFEKVVEENLQVPQLYPVEIGPVVERKVPYFILKGRSLYPAYQTPQIPLYSLPIIDDQRANIDSVHPFQGYVYGKPPINFDERGIDVNKRNLPFGQLSNVNPEFSKKLRSQFTFASSTPILAHSTVNNSGPAGYRRHRIRGFSKNDPKMNDVSSPSSQYPSNHQNQGHLGIQWKSSSHSTAVTHPSMTSASFRGSRQPKTQFQTATGNFRQSKMEYGFKPPMVPSVQYDEDTATKVEN